jgi:hypothetical protein
MNDPATRRALLQGSAFALVAGLTGRAGTGFFQASA